MFSECLASYILENSNCGDTNVTPTLPYNLPLFTYLKIFKVSFDFKPSLNPRAPLAVILLLLRSSSTRVLFSFSDSPTATAPSSANPFHERSRALRLQLALRPLPIAIAPGPRKWFQLRLRISSESFASIAGPVVDRMSFY